jgi:imidazolonepropionase-like amidohydrolase
MRRLRSTAAPGRAWRAALYGIAITVGAALLAAQTNPPPTAAFRFYAGGQEIGRESDTFAVGESGRTLESSLTFNDLGGAGRVTASLDAGFDWAPRHLVLSGQPFGEGNIDLDVTVADGRAALRDGEVTRALALGDGLFFPLDGPVPAALQEHLIAYWRSHGRPAEIASAPGAPIHIQSRADQQVEVGGHVVLLERLSIEGPIFGRQTAWAEPSGRLDALVTWAGSRQFQAVREGFEPRLEQFIQQALRDRMDDVDRLSRVLLPEQPVGVVLTGATVIPGGGRPVIADGVVAVRDGRIIAVGPASKVKPPEGLPVVDAKGMTIIPGLWDVDARMSQVELAPAYLAAGITNIRQTTQDQAFVGELRDAIASTQDRLVLPRLFPATALDARTITTDDEVRQTLRRLHADGAHAVDVERATPAVLRTMAAEGRRLGLSISARISDAFTVEQRAAAGLDLAEGLPGATQAATIAAFGAVAKAKVVYAPQAAWTELLQHGASPDEWWNPGAARLPASLQRRYSRLGASAASTTRIDHVAMLRAAHEAGVTLVAGTGPGVPVAGLFRELELLVQSGMTPADALQAATSAPAAFMKAGDSGTIESGKRADLVVLTGNPLENIANIRTAKWVVANGKLFDCAKLWSAAGFSVK